MCSLVLHVQSPGFSPQRQQHHREVMEKRGGNAGTSLFRPLISTLPSLHDCTWEKESVVSEMKEPCFQCAHSSCPVSEQLDWEGGKTWKATFVP